MVSAVLLAAGTGRRLGGQKALLPFAGTNLLSYQLEQLQGVQGIGEMIVVTGYQQEALLPLLKRPGLKVINNPDYAQGKTTSIKAGLKALSPQATAVLIIGVDEPRPASLLQTLVQEHEHHGGLITLPTYKGRPGHPPILSYSLLPQLLAITEEGQGLRQVIREKKAQLLKIETDSPWVLVNVNTQEDYRKAQQLLEAKGGEKWGF